MHTYVLKHIYAWFIYINHAATGPCKKKKGQLDL